MHLSPYIVRMIDMGPDVCSELLTFGYYHFWLLMVEHCFVRQLLQIGGAGAPQSWRTTPRREL